MAPGASFSSSQPAPPRPPGSSRPCRTGRLASRAEENTFSI